MTAAIHNFARLTGTDLATPGQREAGADIVGGDIILDPASESFLPCYVWTEGAYSRKGARVMVVRTISDDGRLGRREFRTLPDDTYVTVWPAQRADEHLDF